jgi:circadian clock protein KaiB
MAGEGVVFKFRLYVTGHSERSQMAEANLRTICENHLRGRYELEVIDALERPDLAETERILATPTVIRLLPLPERRVIGDLSHRDRTASALGIAVGGNQAGEREEP